LFRQLSYCLTVLLCDKLYIRIYHIFCRLCCLKTLTNIKHSVYNKLYSYPVSDPVLDFTGVSPSVVPPITLPQDPTRRYVLWNSVYFHYDARHISVEFLATGAGTIQFEVSTHCCIHNRYVCLNITVY
jgi:hypothetical protein